MLIKKHKSHLKNRFMEPPTSLGRLSSYTYKYNDTIKKKYLEHEKRGKLPFTPSRL